MVLGDRVLRLEGMMLKRRKVYVRNGRAEDGTDARQRVILVWLSWLMYILILVRRRNGREDDNTSLGTATTLITLLSQ